MTLSTPRNDQIVSPDQPRRAPRRRWCVPAPAGCSLVNVSQKSGDDLMDCAERSEQGMAGGVEPVLDANAGSGAVRHPFTPLSKVARRENPGAASRVLEQRLCQTRLLRAFIVGEGLDSLIEHIGSFIYHSFAGVIHYDRIALAFLDEQGTTVRLCWHWPKSAPLYMPADYAAPLKGSSLETVIASGRPRIIDDLEAYLRQHPQSEPTRLIVAEGMRSNLTCPLVVNGHPIGFIFFSSCQRNGYQPVHVQTFQRIANEISAVIAAGLGPRKSRHGDGETLGRALVHLVNSVELAYGEAALINSVTQKINAGLGLSEVLEFVYESFFRIIPYDRIGCALLEDGGRILRACWVKSNSGKVRLRVGYTAPMAGSSLKVIEQTGIPRIINDLNAYLREHPTSASTRRIVGEGMRSSLTCPLIALGKPVGFLFFSSKKPHTYAGAHVQTFMRVAGQLSLIVEKGRCYEQITQERARSEHLLARLLPPVVAQRLKTEKGPIADAFEDVTVLFADLVDFSQWSSTVGPTELVRILNCIFTAFDHLARRYGVEKISCFGNGYLAVAGLPVPRADHAVAAANLALAMCRAVRRIARLEDKPLEVRIGIHSGPVVAGIVGELAFQYDIWGPTVNYASRMEALSSKGQIHVSQQTFDKIHDAFRLEERRLLEVKGFGRAKTYWLKGPVLKQGSKVALGGQPDTARFR